MPLSNHPFVEPVAVPDTYASGLARVEEVTTDVFRFTLFARQSSLIDSTPERVIVSRIVMTRPEIEQALVAVEMALAGVGGAVGKTLVEIAN